MDLLKLKALKMSAYKTLIRFGFVGLLFICLIYCKKETPKVLPTVTASSVINITPNSAKAGGEVTLDGGSEITARGVCWSSTITAPTTSDSKTIDGSGLGLFTSTITGLTAGTTYNIRAYATNSVGTAYYSQLAFKTLALAPVLTTTDFSTITATSFLCGGNITNDGGSTVTTRGVCWSNNQNPTINDSKTSDGSGTGSFTSSVTGLSAGTTYYVRAYATNSIGTSYGNQLSSKTLALFPILTTISVTYARTTTATSGGNITSDGGGAITVRGVCWSTTSGPTINNSKTSDNIGTGIFSSSITGLTPGTIYFIRAYASNSAGTAYGNELSFKTGAIFPTLLTTNVSQITSTTASSGGNITSDGGAAITERGVCWSTSQYPTISNAITSDGIGAGIYNSSISVLWSSMTYYVRAYATNSIGTSYGNQVSFTTEDGLPNLSTILIANSVNSGGYIWSDGGSIITSKGVCWSTSHNPTIANSKTNDGQGPENFHSTITGLIPGILYYVRAYAINSTGTGYGNEIAVKK